jgi:probable rRNA maturation factor
MPEDPDSSALPEIDILVEAGTWPSPRKLRVLARRSLAPAVQRVRRKLPGDAELSLVFTDDAHIRVLNKRHRKKDKATNVLSFPAPSGRGAFGPMLGDIVFASETVTREAERDGISLEDHLTHLIVHGFLHLLGYDHENGRDATVMEGLETAILAHIGIADPYGERAP